MHVKHGPHPSLVYHTVCRSVDSQPCVNNVHTDCSRLCDVQFAVYVAYAGRLENAFLADEMASIQATLKLMDCISPGVAKQDASIAAELSGDTQPVLALPSAQCPVACCPTTCSSGQHKHRVPNMNSACVVAGLKHVSLLNQATAATSAAGNAAASTHEPILSVSPHVPRCMIRDACTIPPASPLKAGSLEPVASAPVTSLVQTNPTHAVPTVEKPGPQQRPLPSSYSKAHRQLFASQSAPSRQLEQQQQLQQLHSLQQAVHHTAHSPREAAAVPDECGEDQARLRGLQLYSRQRLFFCKLCRNPARGLLCEPSSMQKIEYYQGGDVPLASFVAASAPQKCSHPACGDGVAQHLRTYLHNRGRITLSISQTAPGKELPGADNGQVWFWARPLQVSLFSIVMC